MNPDTNHMIVIMILNSVSLNFISVLKEAVQNIFVARTEELSKLSDAMTQASSASLVYGKRRVGKTRLIREALKRQNRSVIYYECIKGTMQENINAFTRLLTELQVLTFTSSFQSFSDVFAWLNTLPRSFVVVIDEYPYLSSLADAEIVDSVFQTVIDQKLSNIHLVLSGSQVSVMKNLLRFWFTYIHPNRSALQMIGPKAFYDQQTAPSLLTEYVPRCFEEMCRSFLSRLAKSGRLPGITNIGTYYYDDPVRRRNGEFDIALEFGNQHQIYEAKYYRKPMPLSEIHKEIGQIRDIESLSVTQLGFIAVNGFEKQEDGLKYYTGEDLYR